MQRTAEFHKVGFEQFKADWADVLPDALEEEIIHIYEGTRLPARTTSSSAGYDFSTPVPLTLAPDESTKIPTGIRAEIDTSWVLRIFPRDSLGFKFRLQLNNTVGIIDNDCFCSDNEGHVFIKVTSDSGEGEAVELGQGAGLAQGVFVPYGTTADGGCNDVRNDGFGSTGAR